MASSLAAQRLDWVKNQIDAKRPVYITFSCNPFTNVEKIKFVIDMSGPQVDMVQHGAHIALRTLMGLIDTRVVVDKGHRSHSSQKSHATFWVKEPLAHSGLERNSNTNVDILPPVPPPLLDPVLDGGFVVAGVETSQKLDTIQQRQQSILSFSSGIAEKLRILETLLQPMFATICSSFNLLELVNGKLDAYLASQGLLDTQNATISALRAWADSDKSILTKLDNLSEMIEKSVGNGKSAGNSVYPGAPMQRMKRYRFKRIPTSHEAQIQAVTMLDNCCAQVTARMIEDEYCEDISLNYSNDSDATDNNAGYVLSDLDDEPMPPLYRNIPQELRVSVNWNGVIGEAVAMGGEPTTFNVLFPNGDTIILNESQMRTHLLR